MANNTEKRQWKDLSDDEEEIEDQKRHQELRAEEARVKAEKKENDVPVAAEGATTAEKKYVPGEKKPISNRRVGNKGPVKRKHKIEYLETKKQGIKTSKNVYDLESSSDEEEEEQQEATLENAT